ncbi:MAG: hypothetical protein RLO52_10370 [Sandaracinaceae bacterium]
MGVCVCAAGQITCAGDGCVDPSSDPSHCGGCGNDCAAGGSCVSGACTCPPGLVPDGGNCRDVSSDPDHCGAVDNRCARDERCVDGGCACRPGLTEVDGACVDLASDPGNCGTAGTTCPDVCAGGACATDCGGLTECGGACVDTDTNPAHCGGCGDACDADEVCEGGSCNAYRPATGCTSCPCEICRGDSCCEYPSASTLICVDGDCP